MQRLTIKTMLYYRAVLLVLNHIPEISYSRHLKPEAKKQGKKYVNNNI